VSKQAEFAAALAEVVPGVRIERDYQIVFNGLAVRPPVIDEVTIRRIMMMPGVKMVTPEVEYHLTMDASLPLIGASVLWDKVGGVDNAGAGIKIANIDTGIYQDNIFFDPTGFTYPTTSDPTTRPTRPQESIQTPATRSDTVPTPPALWQE
jgi:hypothetical protein